MKLIRFQKSFSSALIALPKAGGFIPPEIAEEMTPAARSEKNSAGPLLRVCESTALQDIGLVASLISPLVVDLSVVMEHAIDHPDSFYAKKLGSGQPIYDRPDFTVDQKSHRLRHAVFYQPFHDQIAKEIKRLGQTSGDVLLLIVDSLPQRIQPRIEIKPRSPSHHSRLPTALLTAVPSCAEGDIEIQFCLDAPDDACVSKEQTSNAFVSLHQGQRVSIYEIGISSACYLTGDEVDEKKCDLTADCIARLINHFQSEIGEEN